MTNVAAVGYLHGDGQWTDGAILAAPGAGTTAVTVTGLQGGNYWVHVTGSCDVAWTYDVKLTSAGGATTRHVQRRRPAAGNEDFLFGSKIRTETNDEITVITVGANAGSLQMSLFVQQVG
jgi:hypothetical protein